MTLSITHRGNGIDPALLPHIFDEFSRENWKYRKDGIGLSFALSRAIVEYHGGTMDVRSIPGSATCFTVRLKSA